MDELTRLLRESFEYSMTNVHTAFPGVVVKYDPKTRRADVQPSIKRRLPSDKFVDFPVIPDVPVLYPGTRQYTIHYPLEKDDEVLCVIMERGTDAWRDSGGSGIEEPDPRRYSLMDCVAIPGLQPVEFIEGGKEGLSVIHKTKPDGDFISSVVMDDDRMEAKYKDSVDVLIEDKHVRACVDKGVLDIGGNKLSYKNDKKDVFTVLSKILDDAMSSVRNVYSMETRGSPAKHKVSPGDVAKLKGNESDLGQDKDDLSQVMKAGK